MAVIDLIEELVPFLSQDPLTVEDVIARIGSLIEDPGIPMPIRIEPKVHGVQSARLARFPDSGLPYLLILELQADARPSVASLRAIMGDYDRVRTDRGMPREILFSPEAVGRRWRIVVIAQPQSDEDEAPVNVIFYRRDPR
jgi:hypothetical protein